MKEFEITIKTVVGTETIIEKVPYYTQCNEVETSFFNTVFSSVDKEEFGLPKFISMQKGDKTKELKFFTYYVNGKKCDAKLCVLKTCGGVINGLLDGTVNEKSTSFNFVKVFEIDKGNNTSVYQFELCEFIPENGNTTMTIKEVNKGGNKKGNSTKKTDAEKFKAYCKKLLDSNTFDKETMKSMIDEIDLTVSTSN